MKHNQVRKGQVYKAVNSNVRLRIVNKKEGGYWMSIKIKKDGSQSRHSHRVHEGTLQRFYHLIEDDNSI